MKDTSRIVVGKIIKELRIKHKLTQFELGLLLEVDRQYISKIEKGKINLTLDYLDNLLEKLNYAPTQLFHVTNEK